MLTSTLLLWLLLGLVSGLVGCLNVQHPLQDRKRDAPKTADGPLNQRFGDRVAEMLDHFHIPALSIAVVDGDKTFAKGYGIAAFPDEEATPETLYYAGSTTKSFTAASILKLVERSVNDTNPLTLKTKLASLTDEFALADDYATGHVTLEDALSHRTGMPRHDSSYGGPNATLKGLVRSVRHLPLSAEIREEWQYCNIMFMTLSYMIETVTSSRLGDFFHANFWQPLGMHSTFLALADAQRAAANGGPPLAKGYRWDNQTRDYVQEDYMDSPIVSGAGHVISNVLDYAKYLRAMMTTNTTILSEESYMELRSARSFSSARRGGNPLLPWDGPDMYSLGWQMSAYRGHQVFYHDGSVTGFGALMAYLPTVSNGVAIAAMANTQFTSNIATAALAFAILDEYLDTPEEERWDIVAIWDEAQTMQRAKLDPENARGIVFPDAPPEDKALPLPLPLESYEGSYWNDGYGNLTVKLVRSGEQSGNSQRQRLQVDVLDKLWQYGLTFEHVTANYFLAWTHGVGKEPGQDHLVDDVQAAEFLIGLSGRVEKMGIQYEQSMRDRIWFERRD